MSHINDITQSIKNGLTPIHPDGPKFAIIAFLIGLLLSWFFWDEFLWIGVVLALYCLYFFRDPHRVTPSDPNLVIAPADGLIQKIMEVIPPAELGLSAEPLTRISIFLNIFDVHINRVPVSGKVTAHHYASGKFFNAELDKASDENERQLLTFETAKGQKIGCIQIAGLVARRIVCNLSLGQDVTAGERFGLIRFGSRVDVFLPKGSTVLALEGQRSIGGETVLARLA